MSDLEVDPAADFLAREQDQLAGLEDLEPAVTNGTPLAALDSTGSFEMINTLGQADSLDPLASTNDLAGFACSEPGLDFLSEPPSSVLAEGADESPPQTEETAVPPTSASPESPKSAAVTSRAEPREEPEKIKKWREEQKKRLEEKDANEEKEKTKMREVAAKELEEWYKHHNELIAKTKATNRNAEKQFVAESDAIKPGTEWERITKLCDFNPKSSRASKDVSRMRSIILQLKQSPLPIKSH